MTRSLWDFDVSCGNFSVASFQFVKPLDTNEASPLADHVNVFSVLALRQVWQNSTLDHFLHCSLARATDQTISAESFNLLTMHLFPNSRFVNEKLLG